MGIYTPRILIRIRGEFQVKLSGVYWDVHGSDHNDSLVSWVITYLGDEINLLILGL